MDASLQSRAEELAAEFANQATTAEELNELMRLMMKLGLERMLNTEMDVHLGRRSSPANEDAPTAQSQAAALPAETSKQPRRIAATAAAARRCKGIWAK